MTIAKGQSARHVMTGDPVFAHPWTTITELAQLFDAHDISGAPVVDSNGKLVGVVSKTDLIRRAIAAAEDNEPLYLFQLMFGQETSEETEDQMLTADAIPEPQMVVEDFMTPDPISAEPDTPVEQLARLMSDARVHRLIVVEDEAPVGIVTSLDLLRAWAADA